jgi:sugar lactone lactonase YvrE
MSTLALGAKPIARMAVDCVLRANNFLGETPIWSPEEQALWWVNCEHPPELLRWVSATGSLERWPMPMRVGGFVPAADGTLLVALADGLYDFEPKNGHMSLRVSSPFPEHVKLHECQCDRQGRFWVGGFDHLFPNDLSSAAAYYCRLDGDRLTPLIEGIQCANGLAFSPDGRTVYLASSPAREVIQFDLNPASGDISNRRTFITLEEGYGYIDGATVDTAGGYWLAVVGAAALRRYLPNGTLDREIPLPFSNPTKPAFGGPDMRTLFVTSTKMKIDPKVFGQEANGDLFALQPGEQGITETPFAG